MHALIALMLAQATPTVAAADPLPIPMNHREWSSMTHNERLQYADITIQALRRNPVLARCQKLEPAELVRIINAQPAASQPLIMTVAAAAYSLCN